MLMISTNMPTQYQHLNNLVSEFDLVFIYVYVYIWLHF